MKFENIRNLMEQHKELLEVLDKENYNIEIQEDFILMKKQPYPNIEVKILLQEDFVKIKSAIYDEPFAYYCFNNTENYEFYGEETNKDNVVRFLPENNKLIYLRQVVLFQNNLLEVNDLDYIRRAKGLSKTITKFLEETEV